MPDKNAKHPLNAPGPYYVDTTCSMCRNCLAEAPTLLTVVEDETAVYFNRQPANDEEKAAAQRAMDVCPTLSIGNDG